MTDTTTRDALREMCKRIADQIEAGCDPEQSDWAKDWVEANEEEPTAYDWLSDCLEITYHCTAARDYLGARVLVSYGGPNIWVDTRFCTIEGYWGGTRVEWHYRDHMGLDDACAELWEMG